MPKRSSIVVAVNAGERVSDRDLEEWARLQERDEALASPFFRPEFMQLVAAVRSDVAVAVVQGDEGAAFFAFQRRRLGRGGPLASRLSDYQGIVGSPPPGLDARELLRRCRLRSWGFDAVVASQPLFRPYHRRERSSPFLDVTRGYDVYADERAAAGSDQIADVGKQAERLAADVGALRFEVQVADTDALALLMRWKSEQYLRTSAVDIFAFPWVRAVASRVHGSSGAGFAGVLSVLYAGDRPVAAHLGLRSPTVLHYWLPAYDRAFAKYSPGLILLLQLAQGASAFGARRVDLGKGDALYKRRLANGAAQLASGSVEANSATALAASASRFGDMLVRKTPLARRLDVLMTRRSFA
jgi:CelD/BcsL family acetyltransferase involved in cellulose biosynthesis